MPTPGTHLLTPQQIRFMEKLPKGHTVVSVRGRAPIVRRLDGQLLRIRPSGRPVPTIPVERVQSYLHVLG